MNQAVQFSAAALLLGAKSLRYVVQRLQWHLLSDPATGMASADSESDVALNPLSNVRTNMKTCIPVCLLLLLSALCLQRAASMQLERGADYHCMQIG